MIESAIRITRIANLLVNRARRPYRLQRAGAGCGRVGRHARGARSPGDRRPETGVRRPESGERGGAKLKAGSDPHLARMAMFWSSRASYDFQPIILKSWWRFDCHFLASFEGGPWQI